MSCFKFLAMTGFVFDRDTNYFQPVNIKLSIHVAIRSITIHEQLERLVIDCSTSSFDRALQMLA